MSITPLMFTGVSEFSDDFQTILDRSAAIAGIPLQQMQIEQADLLTKKQLLTDLRVAVGGVANAVTALGNAGATKALTAISGNANRVGVTLNGATEPATYTVSEITSIAKAASETTSSGYATADAATVSGDGILELVVGSNTYTVDLTGDYGNTLNGLRDAINALGAGVTATVLNTGTGETPYYLSIAASTTGATTLQLREAAGESGTNILTSDNQGANAVFKLNGLSVTKSGNVINDVISGLTLTIVSLTDAGETVSLTLSPSRGELASKLSSLVSAYNTLVTQVSAQVGETAGLLSGDFIVREVQAQLRTLTSYRDTGTISSLIDVGIEFDQTGVMSLNQNKFYSLTETQLNAAFEFLGSTSTGFGALSANFTQISDPVTGMIKTQQDQYDIADERLGEQITELAARIDLMQASLSWKLQQADVLLAQLESQQTLLDASIESLNLLLYGRQDT